MISQVRQKKGIGAEQVWELQVAHIGVLARHRYLDTARHEIEALTRPRDRVVAFLALAEAHWAMGHQSEAAEAAKALVNRIDSERDRAHLRLEIAKFLARNGRFDRAVNEIRRIEGPKARLLAIVHFLAEFSTDPHIIYNHQGMLAEFIVLETQSSMGDINLSGTDHDRAFAMLRGIFALTALGDGRAASQIPDALYRANTSLSPEEHVEFLIEISEFYLFTNQPDNAVEVHEKALVKAEKISDESARAQAIWLIRMAGELG